MAIDAGRQQPLIRLSSLVSSAAAPEEGGRLHAAVSLACHAVGQIHRSRDGNREVSRLEARFARRLVDRADIGKLGPSNQLDEVQDVLVYRAAGTDRQRGGPLAGAAVQAG